jgi:uncharacterized protein
MCALPLNRLRPLPHPESINAYEFAKQMLEIHGRIRASHFSALRDALFLGENDASEVEYAIQGEKGRNSKYALRLSLSGQLNLICQRCLGELHFPLQHKVWFDLVADESQLQDDDEIDYLVADTDLDIEQLIGQELLLGLPFAPKHGEAGSAQNALCPGATVVATEHKPNPFSVLQGLKSNMK